MTSKAKAEAILQNGFRDASKQYLTSQEWAGVWVSKLLQSLAYYDIMARLPMIKASSTMVLYGEVDRLRDGEDLLHNNIINAQTFFMKQIIWGSNTAKVIINA